MDFAKSIHKKEQGVEILAVLKKNSGLGWIVNSASLWQLWLCTCIWCIVKQIYKIVNSFNLYLFVFASILFYCNEL